jgi:hypothetical protein
MSKQPAADSPYVKVYISKAGEITVDGKAATIDEVERSFSDLAKKSGVVLYTRESPEEPGPHPNASKVIALVAQNRLPIRLCIKKDFSDALGPDGKLLVDK